MKIYFKVMILIFMFLKTLNFKIKNFFQNISKIGDIKMII